MSDFPLDTDNSPSRIIELLYHMKVRDVMSTNLRTAGKSSSLLSIQEMMRSNGISGIPIVEGRRLVGLVSVDDIIRALSDGRIKDEAQSIMTRNLIVLEDDMPLTFAISYMEKYRFGRFPVISKDRELTGIITSRDIITHLLISINSELEQLEEHINNPVEKQVSGKVHLEWATRKLDFEEAGRASTEIKKELRQLRPGIAPKLLRRIAIASYELEMNQVVHSEGGVLMFSLEADRVKIRAEDRGPGIENLEEALTEGWTTATEWVRSLGFGAGMGLPNTRRVADSFHIESSPAGTIVEVSFSLAEEDSNRAKPDQPK